MTAVIDYALTAMDASTHEFSVCMRIPDPDPDGVTLALPAWIPGSYMIRDFARNITHISARDNRGRLALRKLDKQRWRTGPCVGELVIDYRVYAFDLSVRGTFLDDTRAYFNGACLFLAIDGRTEAPWRLRIERPGWDLAGDWRVATTLPANAIDDAGFGVYAGQGYATLIDYPVEIGRQRWGGFSLDGIDHAIAVTDGGHFDIDRICADLARVCAEHAALFGELPVGRYLFLTLATDDGYGGLEHWDSTSLVCKRSDLPGVNMARPAKGYKQFLGLCSHEYFHLWNVKRIRPARLAGADLGTEAYTELLWAFEGITSYYDDLALARSGVIETTDYLELLASVVSRVMRGRGRMLQSIAESSFDAWTRFYKQDENAPNAIVSYYAKGALVALGLDVQLRLLSQDRACLDDLMRRLWARFGNTGRGVPERGIEGEVEGLLGRPLDGFFDEFVYGTAELPLANWFAQLGIGFRLRAARGADDNGGTDAAPPSDPAPKELGARYEASAGGLKLGSVFAGGAAQQAGLAPGDVLIALDGERLDGGNLRELLARAAGDAVDAHYFRRGRLMVTRLPVCDASADTCDLWLLNDEQLSSAVRERRAAWLRGHRRVEA